MARTMKVVFSRDEFSLLRLLVEQANQIQRIVGAEPSQSEKFMRLFQEQDDSQEKIEFMMKSADLNTLYSVCFYFSDVIIALRSQQKQGQSSIDSLLNKIYNQRDENFIIDFFS